MKICIVISDYYKNITKELLIGAEGVLKSYGIKKYSKIYTTGIFETPVVISRNIKKYDGFVALGCVIKGETPHFDFICSAAINAIMQISIVNKKPIGNGILTCHNMKQALKRANPKGKNKGGEASMATISVLKIKK
tara:strand:+ start:19435 stop:19842 length:408 start_codon:yes stop_codon:yes gene_type:complete